MRSKHITKAEGFLYHDGAAVYITPSVARLYHDGAAVYITPSIARLYHDGSFPEVKGYSVRNLKYMAKFAVTYEDEEFVQTVKDPYIFDFIPFKAAQG